MQEAHVHPNLKPESQCWALNLSPPKMALVMTLVIFIVELCVMLLLDRLPTFPPVVEAFVDSCFLIAFLVPAYIAIYRPFWQVRLQSQEEIRRLNHRLVEVGEEEKRRVALDLHDHCDQTLVALQRTIELVQGKIIDTSEEAAALCQEVDELLGRLNHDVRAVSAALHPPQLVEQGVGISVRNYLDQIQRQYVGVSIEAVDRGTPYPVSELKAVAIYRIVQEALKNAVRHAEPTLIRVYLEYTPTSFSVTIIDDGKGFDPKTVLDTGGVGLVSMRERARSNGGSFVVHSEPGRGTSLRVSFKL